MMIMLTLPTKHKLFCIYITCWHRKYITLSMQSFLPMNKQIIIIQVSSVVTSFWHFWGGSHFIYCIWSHYQLSEIKYLEIPSLGSSWSLQLNLDEINIILSSNLVVIIILHFNFYKNFNGTWKLCLYPTSIKNIIWNKFGNMSC